MKEIIRVTSVIGMAVGFVMLIVTSLAWGYEKMTGKKPEHKQVIIMPNDMSMISKYEGDPSLLSAYTRNDTVFINFEGY